MFRKHTFSSTCNDVFDQIVRQFLKAQRRVQGKYEQRRGGDRGRGRHICFCFNKKKIKGNPQSGKHLNKIIKFAVSVKWKKISFYKYLTCSELINIMILYARTDISLFNDAPHSLCTPFTDTLVVFNCYNNVVQMMRLINYMQHTTLCTPI